MIYAIHKVTKEHRVIGPGDSWDIEWRIVQADPDGWIEWQGGECPLPEGQRYEVKSRDGEWGEGVIGKWVHGSRQKSFDIIAYRPVLDADTKPEPPAWGGEGLPPVGARGVDGDGDIVEVVAHHHGHAVCYLVDYADHQYIDVEYSQFRPIRSEEDRSVEAAAKIIAGQFDATLEDCLGAARALCRAGMRLPKETPNASFPR